MVFFERAKGEFNTKLRIAGSNKNRYAKEYPTTKKVLKGINGKNITRHGEINLI